MAGFDVGDSDLFGRESGSLRGPDPEARAAEQSKSHRVRWLALVDGPTD